MFIILTIIGKISILKRSKTKFNNIPFRKRQQITDTNTDCVVVNADQTDQYQLEQFPDENRKLLNSLSESYEGVSKIQLYRHEFEKTPKKSIKRHLYSTSFL